MKVHASTHNGAHASTLSSSPTCSDCRRVGEELFFLNVKQETAELHPEQSERLFYPFTDSPGRKLYVQLGQKSSPVLVQTDLKVNNVDLD